MHLKTSISLFVASISFLFFSCTSVEKQEQITLIPTPVLQKTNKGAFHFNKRTTIGIANETMRPAAEYLRSILEGSVNTTITTDKKKATIYLQILETLPKKGAYELTVTKNLIKIDAADYSGIVSAISTIRQLLPSTIEKKKEIKEKLHFALPCITIKDAPRFAWRGLMLDASRHFWEVEEVEKVLDLMALYKMNRLHWHLTDDQGWRIEIKKYPLLTEKGAWRKLNKNDRECIRLAHAENNSDFLLPPDRLKVVNGDTIYGGFYTQEDIKHVVAYAVQRGIDIIPEIDMPGHFLAAIKEYPEVACSGLLGWGKNFSSPICPGKDSSLDFCKNIYREVFSLFPSKYVHIGGDEVEKTNWKKCADCRKRIQKEHLKSVENLQAWFICNMEQFFLANGKKLIGWDEVGEDGLSNQATIMWWRSWNPKAVPNATAEGKQAICTPNTYLYFDYQQDKKTLNNLLTYNPTAGKLSQQQKELILGVQGNVWAERIPSLKRLEYMIMPRMIALSEIAWATEENVLDKKDFWKTVVTHFDRLDIMDVNYRMPDVEGFYSKNVFIDQKTLTLDYPLSFADIRYTTDGSIPTINSKQYTAPINVTQTTHFTFRTFRPNGRGSICTSTNYIKSAYSKADTVAQPTKKGLVATWHNFRGNKCSAIDAAPIEGTYPVATVSIPKEVRGNIGLVFRGYLDVPSDDVYTFSLLSDDGSNLYLDGELVIENDAAHSSREVAAQKALQKGLHSLEVRYFDHNGGVLTFYSIGKDGSKKIVSTDFFKH